MKKKIKKGTLIKKADKAFSEYWRAKIGHCERCLKKDSLQLAHIVSRSCKKLRYERRNTFVICWSCHWRFHSKPLEFVEFVKKMKGEEAPKILIYESNKLKSLGIDFYQEIIDKYTN